MQFAVSFPATGFHDIRFEPMDGGILGDARKMDAEHLEAGYGAK